MSKRAKIIYISLGILFFSVTVGCIYYLMGGIIPGINDLVIYELGPKTRYVAGVPYEGEPETPELNDIFTKYRNWIVEDLEAAEIKDQVMREGEIDHSRRQFHFLSVINYPTEANKKVKHFIGVAMRGSKGEIPMGEEEVKEFSCQKRYTVFLTMSHWVRPTTTSVQEMITQKAMKNGDSIKYFFEIYYPDNSMQVEGFVKRK